MQIGVELAATCSLASVTGCVGWEEEVPYDWMRSDQAVSPVAVLQEAGDPAEDMPTSRDANVQPVEGSANSVITYCHDAESLLQVTSDQSTTANEDLAANDGMSTNEEGAFANERGTSNCANEVTAADETPPQFCQVEAKQAALP